MGKIEKFEDLDCWKATRELVKLVHWSTLAGKVSKDYGFRDQIQRGRGENEQHCRRFWQVQQQRIHQVSSSSANEVQSLCYAGLELGYFAEEEAKAIQSKANDVKSLDQGLMRYLRRRGRDDRA
jgi:four helix bundle protein